jgi:ferritin
MQGERADGRAVLFGRCYRPRGQVMLTEKLAAALNGQLARELYSAHLYYSAAAYAHSVNMGGAAAWLKAQTREELAHAARFFEYIVSRGGRARLSGVEAPPTDFDSPLEVFRAANEHEREVTRWIGELVELAKSEKDHATENFLQWFVAEQVEEEQQTEDIVKRLTFAGDSPEALFMIDRELGQRRFSPDGAQANG